MWALEAGEDRLTEPLGIPLPGGGSLYDCVDHELWGVFPATLQPQPVADLVEGGAHNLEVIWIDCSPCKRHDECPMTIESEQSFSGNDDGFKCASGRAHGDLISSRSADAASVPKRPSIDKKDQPAPDYDQQRRFDRFNDTIAFKVAFDRPDDAQDDNEDPPVPSHQVEQSELWVHLRARESAPPKRGSRGI
jgi:hypothetical protein